MFGFSFSDASWAALQPLLSSVSVPSLVMPFAQPLSPSLLFFSSPRSLYLSTADGCDGCARQPLSLSLLFFPLPRSLYRHSRPMVAMVAGGKDETAPKIEFKMGLAPLCSFCRSREVSYASGIKGSTMKLKGLSEAQSLQNTAQKGAVMERQSP